MSTYLYLRLIRRYAVPLCIKVLNVNEFCRGHQALESRSSCSRVLKTRIIEAWNSFDQSTSEEGFLERFVIPPNFHIRVPVATYWWVVQGSRGFFIVKGGLTTCRSPSTYPYLSEKHTPLKRKQRPMPDSRMAFTNLREDQFLRKCFSCSHGRY